MKYYEQFTMLAVELFLPDMVLNKFSET